MALYTGIDIVDIDRIEKAVGRWGERFLRRVYTDSEIAAYGHETPSLAARFAAKEAVMKLLGRGQDRIGWRDIEVLAGPEGRPLINLYGRARLEADRLKIRDISISLSHSKSLAIASASGISDRAL